MGNWTYIILTRQERDSFAELVNQYIEIGWKPLGGPFITTFANGHGNIHAFHPATEYGFDDLTIYIEYNQAMIMEIISSEDNHRCECDETQGCGVPAEPSGGRANG